MKATRVLVLAWSCLALGSLATVAFAQFRPGHIGGVVKSEDGNPIRGAVIVAQNKDATPPTLNAVSDDKGRFGLLGLRNGLWSLLVKAPGFEPAVLAWPVRSPNPGPPLEVRLVAIPGGTAAATFDKVKAASVVADLDKASTLLDEGRADEAIAIYRALLERAPSLTSLHLAMARAYRSKKDATRALESYRKLVELEPTNVKARLELALALEEAGDKEGAVRELSRVVEDAPQSAAAQTAREKLSTLK
jgi:tetratricopeptide (TPR) repeat protein